MPRVNVLNQLGEKVGTVTLKDEVYKIEPNEQVVYEVINAERAGMRQGTHKTKIRSEVRGGGRKPWRQKGTGRARQGSIRSPQWVGGGVAFGPQPRDYSKKVNRKVNSLAIKSLLSSRLATKDLIVLDELKIEKGKTKEFVAVLKALELENSKTLVILKKANEEQKEEALKVLQSSNNIPSVKVQTVEHVSAYDLILADKLVLTKEAALEYVEVLK
ncbi:MAG TPA: 50S ribosomal protein L4 [Bacilli bacterium]|jgi:large subunit ribosomal protein L4|nr:50S ribosomal protein L4 [Bacilli bacterium]HNZ74114.1 50S ribosomal protein L4 [Bacilli bacterium]HOC97650.1 50S ribosomal protein L4 [Bacilli bacterium]HPA98724.1 50S ribosomal protein L4 [Bacilli bacterium]HQB79885.1 50S ribosomal protein L4 [Bacilli bacterium]